MHLSDVKPVSERASPSVRRIACYVVFAPAKVGSGTREDRAIAIISHTKREQAMALAAQTKGGYCILKKLAR